MHLQETHKNVAATRFSRHVLGQYRDLIDALLEVKHAAAVSNRDGGWIDNSSSTSIIQAIIQIRSELNSMPAYERERIFCVDVFAGGGSIGIHLNLSEYLAIRSGIDIALINHSQSTADVCHTAFRIAIMRRWPALREAIRIAIDTLACKVKEFADVITLGRTCLQDASTLSLGQGLSAYPEAIKRRLDSIEENISRLKAINLGGTAIGTGENAPHNYRDVVVTHLSRITNLPLYRRENLYDAAQNSDDLGALSADLAQLALVLMKLARDLRMLSSGPRGGFFELCLPKVHEGSSFYKDKNNPIVPETMLQCGFLVLGAHQSVQCALQHAELQLNVFDNVAAINVLDCMDWLTTCLEKFTSYCLVGISANKQRCHELSHLASPLKNQR